MKITLKDGSVFEGTAEEYAELVKIVEGETESKDEYVPKVGDKVRALADSEFRCIEEGEIGTVEDVDAGVDDNDEFRIEVKTDESYCYFRPQDLEKVGEGGTDKFEVGDYVVALPTADENYLITTSEMQLGEVREVYDNFVYIKIIVHSTRKGFEGDSFHVNSKYFRKATDEEVAKFKNEYIPKEGDIVVITGNTNDSRNKVGDIGKVGKYRVNGGVQVEVPSRSASEVASGNYTKFDEMRPATEEEKKQYEQAEKFAKLGRKPGEFKRGDIVRGHRYDDELCKFTGEVEDVSVGMIGVREFDRKYHAANKDDCELIAPVESRVDRVD